MKNNDFEYKYTAPSTLERKEIESIRNSYVNQGNHTSKLALLRKLDNKVKNTPIIFSLGIGIIGLLIFGLGLAMILEWNLLIWGIIVSVIGTCICAFAYPVHMKVLKKLKERYSEEIIKLSDELLNDENK